MTNFGLYPSNDGNSLPELFSKLTPTELQSLTSTLMEASMEAQGLITDMMSSSQTAPKSLKNPDPFGSMAVQAKVGAALAKNPEKTAHAAMTLFQGWMNLFQSMTAGTELPSDRRFSDPEWTNNPAFDFMRRAWILQGEWMQGLIDAAGDELDETTREKARFFTTQMIDAMAPTNLPASNPAALRALVETGGKSILEGMRQARKDIQAGAGRLKVSQTDESAFKLGINVATSKGKVIFRNKLIEVIHYAPINKKMHARPLLIFPPWINKFYILDLQPKNSMIQWLLGQGLNVFLVSWRSADDETGDYRWDDYIDQGIFEALDVVINRTGADSVNTVGYCIGGSLLTTALAHMAQIGDTRVHSATYFASQSDFSNAGELKIFTGEDALSHIDTVIDDNDGIMPGEIMGETFNWLRPSDLVWRYVVDNYMLGKPPKPFDLLYWNADQTNIPGPTHRTYLRKLYNENALAEGKFEVFGDPVNMADIKVPVFIQAGRSDHICPWESIYLGAQNFGGDTMFTLAGSGHIAGVINHPDANKYQHWVNPKLPADAGQWLAASEEAPGSWWPVWWKWLKPISGELVEAEAPEDRGLGDAPGQFAALRLSDIANGKKPAGPYSTSTERGTHEPKAKPKAASAKKAPPKIKAAAKTANTAK